MGTIDMFMNCLSRTDRVASQIIYLKDAHHCYIVLMLLQGLRPEQVHECIDTYERLNVWQLNTAKTKLTFI